MDRFIRKYNSREAAVIREGGGEAAGKGDQTRDGALPA